MNNFDSTETSITKGCFAHKPTKLKKRKRTKTSKSSNYYAKDFKHLWNKIENKIKEIESSSYKNTFDAVSKYVFDCIQSPFEQDEIPAAVLQMGVNMPDHSNILKQLEKLLRSQKCYTAILESKKCHNFSNAVQLIDNELQNQSSEIGQQSPSKQARFVKQNKLKPLILIIQDVETFSVQVLEELILNCKIYLGKLPIVLIFGMSSAMVTLHNILPQRVLCHLGIETFYSFAAAEYLTRIIEEVVMSPFQPFKLGPKVFRLVVDTVLYHDFSVTNLKHLLRFSLMKHFHSKGAILLCSESEIKEKVSNLKEEDLQVLKKLPSLQLYKENNPEISSSFDNCAAFKSLLIKLLKDFYSSQNKVLLSLKVLHSLTKDLPGSPLGKQFREIYLLNLEKQICHSTSFHDAEKLLKFQSQTELLLKLKSCQEIFKAVGRNTCENLANAIDQSIQKLTDLKSEDFDKKVLKKSCLENETFTSRFQLQEKMRSSIQLQRSRFETLRNEIVDSLFEYFQDICSPCLLPLHEVFFFDAIHACKRHLMPSPRVVLCSALSNPQQYLECKCCQISESEGEIPMCMPDICVLYKLHLECGKLINLCDWLEAFKALKSIENESKKRNVLKIKADDSKLNIRFLLAATELQLLGFVKPTKRKTDHVARLTFGTF